jgi:hypothetical protein
MLGPVSMLLPPGNTGRQQYRLFYRYRLGGERVIVISAIVGQLGLQQTPQAAEIAVRHH